MLFVCDALQDSVAHQLAQAIRQAMRRQAQVALDGLEPRMPRKTSRMMSIVHRSPMTESVRAIEQVIVSISFQRIFVRRSLRLLTE